MALISDTERKRLESIFDEHLEAPVELLLFLKDKDEQSTGTSLLKELAGLDRRLTLKIHTLKEGIITERYGIKDVPAVAVLSDKDYNIRFFGFPIKNEFNSLIQTIAVVSKGSTTLAGHTKKEVGSLPKDVALRVLITLDCLRCPPVVVLANRFAVEGTRVSSEIIDVREFPEYIDRYKVKTTPTVVVNDKVHEGIPDEDKMLRWIKKA